MKNKNHKGGRRALYTDPELMQKRIDTYFVMCAGELATDESGALKLDKDGRPFYVNTKPPTVTGLALYLGFSDRRVFMTYKNRPGFEKIVMEARLRVEAYCEQALFNRYSYEGARFALSSRFGWDCQAVEQSAEPKEVNVRIINAEPSSVATDAPKSLMPMN